MKQWRIYVNSLGLLSPDHFAAGLAEMAEDDTDEPKSAFLSVGRINDWSRGAKIHFGLFARLRFQSPDWQRIGFPERLNERLDAEYAHVQVSIATTSACGGIADDVLGCAETSGVITLIDGWNWFTGPDPTRIGTGQYEFLTVVTHERGHALGLGHSHETSSVMSPVLGDAETRREFTADDLEFVAQHEDVKALLAEGFASEQDHSSHAGEPQAAEHVDFALQSFGAEIPRDVPRGVRIMPEQDADNVRKLFDPERAEWNSATDLPLVAYERRGRNSSERIRMAVHADALFNLDEEVGTEPDVDLHIPLEYDVSNGIRLR